jgi:hypothetical protein
MTLDIKPITPCLCRLTTAKGRSIHIHFHPSGRITIRGGGRFGLGESFVHLADAASHHRQQDVREALKALLIVRLEALYDGNPLP